MTRRIQELLKDVLEGRKSHLISKAISKTPSYVSQIQRGKIIPTDEVIAEIAKKYAPDQMGELLFAAAIARLERSKFGKGKEDLKRTAVDALNERYREPGAGLEYRGPRSFKDFPEAFLPLAVVTGDKRETRETWITKADFGVFTATPADTRWLLNLGLPTDTIKHVDKNFLLLPDDELVDRFAEMNLLVIGSPAANHLARKTNSSAVFRFNYGQDAHDGVEDLIETAARECKTTIQLAAYQEQHTQDLSKRVRSLFTGGIFDPTYPDEYQVAKYSQIASQIQYDWGILTFSTNPYYALKCQREERENDHRYVAIMAAGMHHPGTAHAVRMLGEDFRHKMFEKHPYGGVLRVELDQNLPFSNRVEHATCRWEDAADGAREEPDDQCSLLYEQLNEIAAKLEKRQLGNLELDQNQAEGCLRLLECLGRT